jgi:hypothetical protein
VPVLTVVVDRPEHIHRWFEIVDDLTDETGLVTSELVPAFRVSPKFPPDELISLFTRGNVMRHDYT